VGPEGTFVAESFSAHPLDSFRPSATLPFRLLASSSTGEDTSRYVNLYPDSAFGSRVTIEFQLMALLGSSTGNATGLPWRRFAVAQHIPAYFEQVKEIGRGFDALVGAHVGHEVLPRTSRRDSKAAASRPTRSRIVG
jgi:hypothetical protein